MTAAHRLGLLAIKGRSRLKAERMINSRAVTCIHVLTVTDCVDCDEFISGLENHSQKVSGFDPESDSLAQLATEESLHLMIQSQEEPPLIINWMVSVHYLRIIVFD